eukprot:253643-Chlamydomonas_euryale.AAC.1
MDCMHTCALCRAGLRKHTVWMHASHMPSHRTLQCHAAQWMHSSSAGLENLLFPELMNSDVVLTNAKGVYSNSLA